MANCKSALKRGKTSEVRRQRKAIVRTALRTSIKKSKIAVNKSDENATALTKDAIIAIDKAVSKGVMHKNTAARKKSQLDRSVNLMKAK